MAQRGKTRLTGSFQKLRTEQTCLAKPAEAAAETRMAGKLSRSGGRDYTYGPHNKVKP